MINEENLATAHLAQLFGSELLKVQNSSQTDAGSVPDIVKIDPKQFLINSPQAIQARKLEEQRLLHSLQQQAEAQYPYEEPLPVVEREKPIQQASSASVAPVSPVVSLAENNCLERIATSLEQIVELLKARNQ